MDSVTESPRLATTLPLEEPSLPTFQQVWRGIVGQRFLLIALSVSLFLHVAIFSVAIQLKPSSVPFTKSLSVRLESIPAAKTKTKLSQQTITVSSYSVPSNPPVVAPQPELEPSRPAKKAVNAKKKNQSIQFAPSPPPMLSWWQYNSEDMGYYGPEELDQLATPTNGAGFLLPVLELTPDQPGRVRAKIYINERGGVDRVEILDSDPPGVFDQAVLLEIYRSSFVPALKGGIAVKSQKEIEIRIDVIINQRLLNSPDAHPGAFELD